MKKHVLMAFMTGALCAALVAWINWPRTRWELWHYNGVAYRANAQTGEEQMLVPSMDSTPVTVSTSWPWWLCGLAIIGAVVVFSPLITPALVIIWSLFVVPCAAAKRAAMHLGQAIKKRLG